MLPVWRGNTTFLRAPPPTEGAKPLSQMGGHNRDRANCEVCKYNNALENKTSTTKSKSK
jgi:hypothetical protein